jgi:ATP-binding cassette subfamily B protein
MAGIITILGRVSWPAEIGLVLGSIPLVILAAIIERDFGRLNYRQSPLKRQAAYWRDLCTRRGPAAELRLFGLGGHFRERWSAINEQLVEELHRAR